MKLVKPLDHDTYNVIAYNSEGRVNGNCDCNNDKTAEDVLVTYYKTLGYSVAVILALFIHCT